jgi:cell division protein FtsI/penicillin-binding protein 2
VLNEGLASPFTTVFCHNGHFVEGKIEVPDHFPYGNLTLEGVLIKSSNIGAYKFARQLGAKRFFNYAHNYGFGRKTGILLSGESSGIAKNTGNAVDFSRAAYGYALNVSPLQMACAYSAIAGDGKLLKPKIIKSLVANDGTVVETYPTEVVAQVIKPETARKMRVALQKVTETGGTATLAAVPGHRVAGKTGTAKRHNPNGPGYLANSYTVSFVGMLPAQNPAFVCVVVIDDPRTDKVPRYGGTIAAPAFGHIAARAAAYMNLQPTVPVTPPLATAAVR